MAPDSCKRNRLGILPREGSNPPAGSGRHPKRSGKKGRENDKGLQSSRKRTERIVISEIER
jgi:hypothetical protein